MHRIVAKDDRDLMGYTMNLNEDQNKFISLVKKGEAAVFSEGFNESFLVKVPYYPSNAATIDPGKSRITNHDVTRIYGKKNIRFRFLF